MFNPSRPYVPYTFPEISFLKLQDYITNLVNQYGGVYWPLDDVAGNSYNRVINPAVATGRELALTPNFATDTNWTKAAGCTISGGVGVYTSTASGAGFTQTVPITNGRVYQVTFTIVSISAGGIRPFLSTAGTTRTTVGTYTELIICGNTTTLSLLASGTTTATIDDVSLKELNIPAYNAVPIQLLNTDVWNGLGTAAWTTSNATITAVSTTRHDGNTGTVVHLVRNAGPATATQTIMNIGLVYRVYGWARGNGTNNPRVSMGIGATTLFTGAVSTDWQPFDLIFVATATTLDLVSLGSVANYVEFDVTVVALDTGIRQDSPGVDLNFEMSGVVAETAVSAATLSKQPGTRTGGSGTQFFRVTSGGNSNGASSQSNLCIGKTYLLTGWARGDGTVGLPRIFTGNGAGATLFTGTISTTWVQFFKVFIATATQFNMNTNSATVGVFADFDDITITELSPLVAVPVNGAVLGNSEAPLRIGTSVSFDGVNDLINLYSAQLNSVFNPAEGSLIIFGKVSASGVWIDLTSRYLGMIKADSNNFIYLAKNSVNNQVLTNYIAGGTLKSVSQSSFSPTGWFVLAITWSKNADQVIFYVNGVQSGSTLTGLGTWSGNLASTTCAIGAQSTAAANPWSGFETQVVLLPAALSASEISEISKLGDAS